ncbi:MAG: acyl-CoA dehydrogenase family protein, partial [Gemmatimonadota bacterium]
ALEILNLRVLSEARTRGAPGPMSSMLKIKGAEIIQRIGELIADMQGTAALPTRDGRLRPEPAMYLNLRKTTIYGGSNEIQRGIIAKHVLEL